MTNIRLERFRGSVPTFGVDASPKLETEQPDTFAFNGKISKASRFMEKMPFGGKLDTSANPIPGSAYGCAWSPNGKWLGVAHNVTPFISVYRYNGNTMVRKSSPIDAVGNARGFAWQPSVGSVGSNAYYVCTTSEASPYFHIFYMDEASIEFSSSGWTKRPDASELPTGPAGQPAWSPDGRLVAIPHQNFPYISIYSFDGSTATKLSNPAILPTGHGNGASWSSDGKYLAVGHLTAPFVTVYRYNGSTFTKIPDPPAIPAGYVRYLSWSPCGNYLACPCAETPFQAVYYFDKDDETFIKIPLINTGVSAVANSAVWSPGGNMLSFTMMASSVSVGLFDGFSIYNVAVPFISGGYLPGISIDSKFSPDGKLLAIGHEGAPYITVVGNAVGDIPGGRLVQLARPSNVP